MPAIVPGQSPLWVPGQHPLAHGSTAIAIDWSHPLARGLAGYWLMNETNPASAQNLVTGAVPTGATAVTTGIAWPAGGPMMTFNGTTSVIQTGSAPTMSAAAPMTVVAVVMTTTVAVGVRGIVNYGRAGSNYGWSLCRTAANLQFNKWASATPTGTATTALTANNWYFVSAAINQANTTVRFGNRMLSLRDVFTTETIASASSYFDGTKQLDLGAARDSAGSLNQFWTGSIGLVMVWMGRELTDGELAGLSYDPFILVRPNSWVALAQAPGNVVVDLATVPATLTSSAIAPSVVLGSLAIAPTSAAVGASAIAPTVVLGSLVVAPASASVTVSAVAPTVPLSIVAAAASTALSAVAPTVRLGNVVVNLAGVQTLQLRPNANSFVGAGWSGIPALFWEWLADEADDPAPEGQQLAPLRVDMTNIAPPLASVTSVVASYLINRTAPHTGDFVPIAVIGGVTYEGTAFALSTVFTTYTWTMTSLVAWDTTLLNGLVMGGRNTVDDAGVTYWRRLSVAVGVTTSLPAVGVLTAVAPTVLIPSTIVTPVAVAMTIAAVAPTVAISAGPPIVPAAASVTFVAIAPSVRLGAIVVTMTDPASLALLAIAPLVLRRLGTPPRGRTGGQGVRRPTGGWAFPAQSGTLGTQRRTGGR